jgi:hypothetical protein
MFQQETPILIEPGTKYFLRETLKNCHNKRTYYYSSVINLLLLLFFLVFLGTFLYYKHKTRLTPKEKKEKQKEQQEYILTKLKTLNDNTQRKNNLLITNLPRFENDFEMMHKRYYKI